MNEIEELKTQIRIINRNIELLYSYSPHHVELSFLYWQLRQCTNRLHELENNELLDNDIKTLKLEKEEE